MGICPTSYPSVWMRCQYVSPNIGTLMREYSTSQNNNVLGKRAKEVKSHIRAEISPWWSCPFRCLCLDCPAFFMDPCLARPKAPFHWRIASAGHWAHGQCPFRHALYLVDSPPYEWVNAAWQYSTPWGPGHVYALVTTQPSARQW